MKFRRLFQLLFLVMLFMPFSGNSQTLGMQDDVTFLTSYSNVGRTFKGNFILNPLISIREVYIFSGTNTGSLVQTTKVGAGILTKIGTYLVNNDNPNISNLEISFTNCDGNAGNYLVSKQIRDSFIIWTGGKNIVAGFRIQTNDDLIMVFMSAGYEIPAAWQ